MALAVPRIRGLRPRPGSGRSRDRPPMPGSSLETETCDTVWTVLLFKSLSVLFDERDGD